MRKRILTQIVIILRVVYRAIHQKDWNVSIINVFVLNLCKIVILYYYLFYILKFWIGILGDCKRIYFEIIINIMVSLIFYLVMKMRIFVQVMLLLQLPKLLPLQPQPPLLPLPLPLPVKLKSMVKIAVKQESAMFRKTLFVSVVYVVVLKLICHGRIFLMFSFLLNFNL